VLDEPGSRHWAESSDPDVIHELLTTDCCEREVTLDGTAASLV